MREGLRGGEELPLPFCSPAKPASRALMVLQSWRNEGRAQGLVTHVGAGSTPAAERAHC